LANNISLDIIHVAGHPEDMNYMKKSVHVVKVLTCQSPPETVDDTALAPHHEEETVSPAASSS
jgi:hypothetical protein